MVGGLAFCPVCGSGLELRYVADEERERLVCTQCGRINYQNPNVVAGVIPVTEGRVWLLRRAIEPRYGAWTFPAGFMELGETVEEAAMRETREELNMEVRIRGLLNVYSRPSVPSVVIVYLADALTPPSGGRETLEFASFAPSEVPWQELAFWNTEAALREWLETRKLSGE
ncbi:MAG TPA: NUDIX hydrolase [Chloroflexota bacterium]|nr:NUDIX hydrolase [Chloroflexota bacterium]